MSDGFYIKGKAAVAQILLQRAFAEPELVTRRRPPPFNLKTQSRYPRRNKVEAPCPPLHVESG
ncbi:hypothetical protein AJ87_31560 [Rhizobium yanglingense]|nr:hypothetical protein AJ87_31560 [Rhizobium yanglingense]